MCGREGGKRRGAFAPAVADVRSVSRHPNVAVTSRCKQQLEQPRAQASFDTWFPDASDSGGRRAVGKAQHDRFTATAGSEHFEDSHDANQGSREGRVRNRADKGAIVLPEGNATSDVAYERSALITLAVCAMRNDGRAKGAAARIGPDVHDVSVVRQNRGRRPSNV